MDRVSTILEQLSSVPISLESCIRFFVIAIAGAIILSFLGKAIFGSRSDFSHAVSSSFGILFLYALGICLFVSDLKTTVMLEALPFVSVDGDRLLVFPFLMADFDLICSQLFRMVLLAFAFNILDVVIPRGKNLFTWLLLRVITQVFAILVQGIIVYVSENFLPELFVSWAPTALLIILLLMMLTGCLKLLVGLVLSTVSPVIGVLYTFFFSNIIGKQISKAVLSTGLLALLCIVLEKTGYTLLVLSGITWSIFLPIMAAILLLWYLMNKI